MACQNTFRITSNSLKSICNTTIFAWWPNTTSQWQNTHSTPKQQTNFFCSMGKNGPKCNLMFNHMPPKHNQIELWIVKAFMQRYKFTYHKKWFQRHSQNKLYTYLGMQLVPCLEWNIENEITINKEKLHCKLLLSPPTPIRHKYQNINPKPYAFYTIPNSKPYIIKTKENTKESHHKLMQHPQKCNEHSNSHSNSGLHIPLIQMHHLYMKQDNGTPCWPRPTRHI